MTVPIRIHLSIIDQSSWLFVQVNKQLDNTRIALQNAACKTLHEQETGVLLPGQMFSFLIDADGLKDGTYQVVLYSGQEPAYKKRVMLQQPRANPAL